MQVARFSVSLVLLGLVVSCSGEAEQGSSLGSSQTTPEAAGARTRLLVDDDPSHYVPVPGPHGEWAHESCVHHIPDGAEVGADSVVTLNGVALFRIPECRYEKKNSLPQTAEATNSSGRRVESAPLNANPYDSNIEGATQTADRNSWGTFWYRGLSARFTVPQLPTTFDQQLVYFYVGLYGDDHTATQAATHVVALHPTLQFGRNVAGGGPYYSIAAWTAITTLYTGYFTEAFTYTTAVQVNPGDALTTVIVSDPIVCSTSGVGCKYYASMQGPNATVSQTYTTPAPLSYAQTTSLESYGTVACTDYPKDGAMQFTSVQGSIPDGNLVVTKNSTGPWTNDGGSNLANCGFGITYTYASGQSYPSGSTIDY